MECVKCKTPLPNHARFCMTCGNDVSGDTKSEPFAPMDPELMAKLQADLGADYAIERELGRGGMAIVYLGEDVHIGRRVAIKLLPPELTFGHGSAFIDRFKREARTAGTLDHPNIIPIFRVSSGGKLFWYVMKYIEGESLDDILVRDQQLSVERVVELLTPAAEALDYAGRKGVIHRDVKPANILVDTEGKVTVTDFGIAKALGSNSLTGSGSILGTPHYMSPEQCAGKKLTGASDQYSLAITAYQMLGGKVPFTGDSAVEIIKQHTLDNPPPLREIRPDIHERVVAAIEKGLAKRPEDRFATASDFVRALDGKGAVVPVAKTAPKRQPQIQVAPRTPVEAGTPSRARKRWSIKWYEVVGAIALGVGAVWLIPPLKKPAATPSSPPVIQGVTKAPVSAESTKAKTPDARPEIPPAAAETVSKAPITKAPVTSGANSKARNTKGQSAPVSAPPPVPQGAKLAMQVSPTGSAVTRDGELVRGDTLVLTAGRHLIMVNKAGFKDWSEIITVQNGERLTRSVTLTVIPEVRAADPVPVAPKVESTSPSPVPSGGGARPAATGRVFIGTSVPASIRLNGRPASNPVNNMEVPAGTITIKFTVTDSAGIWETDSIITVAPDGVFRKRFQLTRPPVRAAKPTTGAAETAHVFIGTNIPATITINGQPTSNPVNNYQVPAGAVRVHFQVTDEKGTWETDSTITVQPDAVFRRRFQLKRP